MKVKITADSKKFLTLEEAPKAREIIAEMKEYEESAGDVIRTAAACWLWNADRGTITDSVQEVLHAEAEIAGNSRVWDRYGDGTGRLDVWVSGTVETFDGFLKIGCYLSDVWELGTDEVNREFPRRTYARYYTERK